MVVPRAVAAAAARAGSCAPARLSLRFCISFPDVLLVVALSLLCYGAEHGILREPGWVEMRRRLAAGPVRAARPAPVLPQCSQAAWNVTSPERGAAWGRGFAEDWHSPALLLAARPSHALLGGEGGGSVVHGGGSRGQSFCRAPRCQNVTVYTVYLLVFNFAKRATVALNSPRKC